MVFEVLFQNLEGGTMAGTTLLLEPGLTATSRSLMFHKYKPR